VPSCLVLKSLLPTVDLGLSGMTIRYNRFYIDRLSFMTGAILYRPVKYLW
jgi:hypothetical protein